LVASILILGYDATLGGEDVRGANVLHSGARSWVNTAKATASAAAAVAATATLTSLGVCDTTQR